MESATLSKEPWSCIFKHGIRDQKLGLRNADFYGVTGVLGAMQDDRTEKLSFI